MLKRLQAGLIPLNDPSLGSNYGRAALSLLVQLVPYINSDAVSAGMKICLRTSLTHGILIMFRLWWLRLWLWSRFPVLWL